MIRLALSLMLAAAPAAAEPFVLLIPEKDGARCQRTILPNGGHGRWLEWS